MLDVCVQRTTYGRQVDSFEKSLEVEDFGEKMQAVFIRAPRFTRLGPDVEVLARCTVDSAYDEEAEPVLAREGRVLACTFHPELTKDRRLHRLFVDLVDKRMSIIESAQQTPRARPAGVVA